METDGQLELCVAQVRGQLARLAEERYRAFSARLLPPGTRLIGVRLPRLRHLAREIAGGDWRAYLEATGKDTFEEVMLQGMVIGCAACSCEERLRRVRGFLPLIDNWSVCDSFCAGLKFTRGHKAEVWSFLEPYFSSKREYSVRFACVMLLDYYVEEADLARDLAVLDRLSGQPYYAMMAVAWAISILYIRYPHAVSAYLLESNLDDVTYQKALQKIMESQQVGAAAKARIRALRQRRASQRDEGGRRRYVGAGDGMGEIRLIHTDGKVIPVEFQRKHIKRMHLHVKGPEGRVVLSAPLSMPRAVLEAFVVENAAWIEQKQQQLRCLPVKQPHRYLTGETIDLWGARKVLVVHVGCSARGEGFLVRGSKVFLSVPEGLTDTQRVRFVREQYRHTLAARMAELAPSLEQRTGLFVREWRTKDMKTRWGTCNIQARRVWINLQLAAKPPICLTYVMLHEILHLAERGHNRRFYALMDRYMPDWRQVRQLLETSPGNC